MDDIIITVFICIVVGVLLIMSFLLGHIRGKYKERMSLIDTLRSFRETKIHKIAIIDALEREWNK